MEFHHSTLEKNNRKLLSVIFFFFYEIQILRSQKLFGRNTLELFLVLRILSFALWTHGKLE